MNAVKRGLLARQVVLQGHYQPDGPVEEMLVDEIVMLNWRLRRVRAAETAEIALHVDDGCLSREANDPFYSTAKKLVSVHRLASIDASTAIGFVSKLKGSSGGIEHLIGALMGVRRGTERDGELTETTLARFNDSLGGSPNHMTLELKEFRARFVNNPAQLDPESLRARHKNVVFAYVDEQIKELEILLRDRKEREEVAEKARQTADLIPSETTIDKILRCETFLQKRLCRAMSLLERTQRRRLGENIPPPAVMEVSSGA
jgi:hypothetical protein